MGECVRAVIGRELKAGKNQGTGMSECVAAATGRKLKAGKNQGKTQGPGWANVEPQQLGES